VFFTLGLAGGTWAARIPAIKGNLHLSAGALGLALLGPAVGSVLAMPATGALLATVAPRRVVPVGLLAMVALLPVTTLAGATWQLFAVLAGWGAGIGVLDVGMNTEAAAAQDRLGRRTMSYFHAAYSVGGLVGAGLGAIAASSGVSAGANFALVSVVALGLGIPSVSTFAAHPMSSRGGLRASRRRWPQWSWTLVFLATIAFGSFLAEGAASDWSAVYLHNSLGASPALAAVGYTMFSCAMTAGRLAGDRLADRVGPVRLVRVSTGVAAVSFGAALLAGTRWLGLAGFALLGLGLSSVVPLVFTAASGLGQPGPNLAMVTSCGYVGMLTGPALIGGLAEVIGLPAALATLVLLCGMIPMLAGALHPKPSTVPQAEPAAWEPLVP
jgi:MFS family permease